MPALPSPEIIRKLTKRREIISALLSGTDDRQELANQVSVSRMTVDRSLRNLEEIDIVASAGSDYWVTSFGRHAHQLYEDLVHDLNNLKEIHDLLEFLPKDVKIDPDVLVDAKIVRASRSTPERPKDHLLSTIKESSEIRLLTPVVDQRILDMLHQRSAIGKGATAVVLDEELAEFLWVEQGTHWKPFVSSEISIVLQIPTQPPYGLLVSDKKIALMVYDNQGAIKGLIKNDSSSALSWAESQFDDFTSRGEELILRSSGQDSRSDEVAS